MHQCGVPKIVSLSLLSRGMSSVDFLSSSESFTGYLSWFWRCLAGVTPCLFTGTLLFYTMRLRFFYPVENLHYGIMLPRAFNNGPCSQKGLPLALLAILL